MSKKQLVLLYGLLGRVEVFEQQKAALSNGMEVIIPDWFSICSDNLNQQENSIEQISSRLIDYLNAHNIKRPILVGHSMGGVIALQMVSRLHYEVERLVILDASLTPSKSKKETYKSLARDFSSAADKAQFIEDIFRGSFFADTDDGQLIEQVIDQAKIRPEVSWFNLLASAVEVDFETLLRQLSMPTVFIASKQGFTDIEKLRSINSDIEVLSVNSGHFISVFAADQLNRFLSGCY